MKSAAAAPPIAPRISPVMKDPLPDPFFFAKSASVRSSSMSRHGRLTSRPGIHLHRL
jgi:hypothetical protein